MKKLIKRVLYKFGVDVHGLNVYKNHTYQILTIFEYLKVDRVLDIGANTGQFVRELRQMGYEGSIVSFEPLSSAYRELIKNSSSDPDWQVYDRCAIGSRDGFAVINISENSVSSSILDMKEAHKSAEIRSAYKGSEEVQTYKLDSIYENLGNNFRDFIKIDTQGFEWEVLMGATETLNKIYGLLVETSFIELYSGQKLWIEVIQHLEARGFKLWAFQPGFMDSRTGQLLQSDAIFIQKKYYDDYSI